MMLNTIAGIQVTTSSLCSYFHRLVNQFFKVLPMWENEEKTLGTYMRSLQVELLGCKELIPDVRDDPMFLTLLSILQYLIDNPSCPVCEVKREVFKAISICGKLKMLYTEEARQ